MYRDRFDMSNYTFSYVGSIAYDALWSLAFALDNTYKMLNEVGRDEILNITGCPGVNMRTRMDWELVSLENFTNDNELMGCVIRWNLQKTNFIGVSVRLKFNLTMLHA